MTGCVLLEEICRYTVYVVVHVQLLDLLSTLLYMSKYWTYRLRCYVGPNIRRTVCVHVHILELLSTLVCVSKYGIQ